MDTINSPYSSCVPNRYHLGPYEPTNYKTFILGAFGLFKDVNIRYTYDINMQGNVFNRRYELV